MLIGHDRPSRSAGRPQIGVSFEFFPPKGRGMETTLWRTIKRLEPLNPKFVSVTYGAGGSTRAETYVTVQRLLCETGLETAAHLTCVGSTKTQINNLVRTYHDIGIRRIVALRGDAADGASFTPHADGYVNAADLVAGIRRIADFDIAVAAYPEIHPNSPSRAVDIDMLKAKVDAGASRAITQFFFDNGDYLRYLELVRAAGIHIAIIPGILPIQNFSQMARFADRCGARLPAWLVRRFEGLDDDPETTALVAAAVAAEQVMELVDNGVSDFHFYTLNRAKLVFAICHLLGLRSDLAVAA